MADKNDPGAFPLGDRAVRRLGYGAMQLAGPGVFGPPRDHAGALAVLREAAASGVDHIDTSDFYGPHVTNRLIREALHPYAKNLTIVTKVGARRGDDASWLPALAPAECAATVVSTLGKIAQRVYSEGVSSERTASALDFIARSVPLREAVERNDPRAARAAATISANVALGRP